MTGTGDLAVETTATNTQNRYIRLRSEQALRRFGIH